MKNIEIPAVKYLSFLNVLNNIKQSCYTVSIKDDKIKHLSRDKRTTYIIDLSDIFSDEKVTFNMLDITMKHDLIKNLGNKNEPVKLEIEEGDTYSFNDTVSRMEFKEPEPIYLPKTPSEEKFQKDVIEPLENKCIMDSKIESETLYKLFNIYKKTDSNNIFLYFDDDNITINLHNNNIKDIKSIILMKEKTINDYLNKNVFVEYPIYPLLMKTQEMEMKLAPLQSDRMLLYLKCELKTKLKDEEHSVVVESYTRNKLKEVGNKEDRYAI